VTRFLPDSPGYGFCRLTRCQHTEWVSLSRSDVHRVPANLAVSWPVRSAARLLTRGRLRILAFHGIPDRTAFERLLDALLDQYNPVNGDQVLAALHGDDEAGRPLYPAWFTFDDGEPSVFEVGPMLAERGVHATAFVCPGVIGTNRQLWFQTLAACQQRGLVADHEQARFSARRLKTVADRLRREETEVLAARLMADGFAAPAQADSAMLRRWLELGHEIGNHTWDHPCLDRCPADEQVTQVHHAHEWFTDEGVPVRFFAYPNGNWTQASADAARDLGYGASLIFDHRLVASHSPVDRVSRLRINSYAPVARGLGILSGAHSAAFHLVTRGRQPHSAATGS